MYGKSFPIEFFLTSLKVDFRGSNLVFRGMVQWRQRTVINGVAQEEGPAITASVSFDPFECHDRKLKNIIIKRLMFIVIAAKTGKNKYINGCKF